ncbi:hypothetical protein [Actinocorallia herbida]|uniref:hypothetical protein n=1 Tax=Actinocorallia herbida TaxID=58109 RepID=UPI0011CDE0FC|nr:hypothetical protein [Actinocorallia herbida]
MFGLAALGLLLLCGACGSGPNAPSADPPVPPSPPSVASEQPQAEAVLEDPRPGQRPAGLDKELRFPVGGGGFNCYQQQEFALMTYLETEALGLPDGTIESGEATVYDTLDPRGPFMETIPFEDSFCVVGSKSGAAVTVTLTDPSGQTMDEQVVTPLSDPSNVVSDQKPFFVRFLPGVAEGTYTLTAVQGGHTVTREIRVSLPSSPKAFAVFDDRYSYGYDRAKSTTVTVAFGGLPPNEPTEFYLYHAGPDSYEGEGLDSVEVNTFHSAHTVTGSLDGTAFLALRITPGTLVGSYYLRNLDETAHTTWKIY